RMADSGSSPGTSSFPAGISRSGRRTAGRNWRTRSAPGPLGPSTSGTAATTPGWPTVHRMSSSPADDSNCSSESVRKPVRTISLEPRSRYSATQTTLVTTSKRRRFDALGLLDSDGLHDVGELLDLVDRCLHPFDDVLQSEDVEGGQFPGEQPGDRPAVDPVGLALQAVDRLELRPEIPRLRQLPDQRHGGLGALDQEVGELERLRERLGDAVEAQKFAGGLDLVDHIVEMVGQAVDVLRVERGDNRSPKAVPDDVGQLVAAEVAKEASRLRHVVGGVVEELVEALVGRHQPEAHRGSFSSPHTTGDRSSRTDQSPAFSTGPGLRRPSGGTARRLIPAR